MSARCETCGQDVEISDDEIIATHATAYRAAHGMLKELWGTAPPEWQVLRTARFLMGEDAAMSDGMTPGEDD